MNKYETTNRFLAQKWRIVVELEENYECYWKWSIKKKRIKQKPFHESFFPGLDGFKLEHEYEHKHETPTLVILRIMSFYGFNGPICFCFALIYSYTTRTQSDDIIIIISIADNCIRDGSPIWIISYHTKRLYRFYDCSFLIFRKFLRKCAGIHNKPQKNLHEKCPFHQFDCFIRHFLHIHSSYECMLQFPFVIYKPRSLWFARTW